MRFGSVSINPVTYYIAWIVFLLYNSVLHILVFITACMSDLQFYSYAHLPHVRTLRYHYILLPSYLFYSAVLDAIFFIQLWIGFQIFCQIDVKIQYLQTKKLCTCTIIVLIRCWNSNIIKNILHACMYALREFLRIYASCIVEFSNLGTCTN